MGDAVDRRLNYAATHPRATTAANLPSRRPPRWLRRHRSLLLVADGAAASVAVVIACYWAFGTSTATFQIGGVGLPYILTTIVAVPAWLLALAVSHGYDLGPFGNIDGQSRRVVSAGAHFLAVTAVLYYAVNIERLAREFLMAIIPLAVALTLIVRAGVALNLRRSRQRGEADRRAVFLGPSHTTRPLVEHLRRTPATGISLVAPSPGERGNGHAGTGRATARSVDDVALRVSTPDAAVELLRRTDADLILVTTTLEPGRLRALTWALEGSGVTVLAAPPSTPIVDTQLDIRPVAGLPLLYVESRRSAAVAV